MILKGGGERLREREKGRERERDREGTLKGGGQSALVLAHIVIMQHGSSSDFEDLDTGHQQSVTFACDQLGFLSRTIPA